MFSPLQCKVRISSLSRPVLPAARVSSQDGALSGQTSHLPGVQLPPGPELPSCTHAVASILSTCVWLVENLSAADCQFQASL